MRVLIVGGVDISRRVLREMLLAWRFEVVEAASASEALVQLKNAHADGKDFGLILLDWKISDDAQTTRAIRAMAHNGEILPVPVVIMVTAFSKDQLLNEMRDEPPDGILVKPVTPSVMLEAITRLQGGKVEDLPEKNWSHIEESSAAIRGAHVLLVEDNEINRMVAREFLVNAGLRISEAYNGQECVEAVRSGQFEAVLMDVQMPVMDGFEATRVIRSDPRFRDLPIIAMTAAVLEQDKEACRVAGMNDHVSKPILPQVLMETLSRWVRPGTHAASGVTAKSAVTAHGLELPGFDFGAVLVLLGGDQVLLKKLLRQFGEKFGDASDELAYLLRSGQKAEAAALVHNIKGTSGNLGAVDLYNTAKRLEEELAAGARFFSAMEEFRRVLTLVLECIARLDEDEAVTEAAPGALCDMQVVPGLLRQLRTLLKGDDFVPHELMMELKAAMPNQSMQQYLRQIEKLIGEFDYEQAKAVLEELVLVSGSDMQGTAT